MPYEPTDSFRLPPGAENGPDLGEVTLVLDAMRRGEVKASTQLLPLVYEELRRHARHRMNMERPGQTLQPTALVHEAWLQLFRGGDQVWDNRAHFFGAAAEAMRRILIDNARRKARLKHGGGQERVDLDHAEPLAQMPDETLLRIDDALERLKAQDPEKAKIVTLKFFGGLTNEQVAETLGVTVRTVERHWAFSKAWLFQTIQTDNT